MSETVLLTLGRLPKGLDLARALASRGFRVLIAEPYAWHLSRVSRFVDRSFTVPPPSAGKQAYLDALMAIIRAEQVTHVFPVSEEAMHVAALLAREELAAKVFCAPQDILLELHHKGRFIERAQGFGLAVPETAAADSAAARQIAQQGDFVCKPVFSCSGKGVSLHRRGDSAAPLGLGDMLVQRRLYGQTQCSLAIVRQGRVALNVVYRPLILSGSVAVSFERVSDCQAVDDWVEAFVAPLDYTGFIAFDFIVAEDGQVAAIECNPRLTSGVHFITPAALLAAIFDEPLPEQPLRSYAQCQQFYPSLTSAHGAFGDWPLWRERMRKVWSLRDVTWQRSDPLPFALMPLTAMGIIWRAARAGVPFGEVATSDIDWFEGESR